MFWVTYSPALKMAALLAPVALPKTVALWATTLLCKSFEQPKATLLQLSRISFDLQSFTIIEAARETLLAKT